MKVFVNDIPLEIVSAAGQGKPQRDAATFAHPSFSQIWRFYEMARDGQIQGYKGLRFEVGNYDKTVADFKSKFLLIEAAGGIVRKQSQILFIFRLGKWDLPKGKLEKGENPEEASIREVEEECGVTASLAGKIGETWHTYKDRKDREVLKCTHWYAMDCQSDEALSPQTEEDIQEVRWVEASQVWEEPMTDTDASIQEIFRVYEKN